MLLLTKSNYIIGLECEKLLWTMLNDKKNVKKISIGSQHVMDEGKLVGQLAKKLYAEGIELGNYSFMDNIRKSKESISMGKPLFEAGFKFRFNDMGECYSRADILVPAVGEWDLIEVKSSTKVKNSQIHDISFQKLCYEMNNLKIRNCYIMHINNQYTRFGELEPDKLFKKIDVTDKVEQASEGLEKRIERMFSVIGNKDSEFSKTLKCATPYDCGITDTWFNQLPENNVFNLHGIGARAMELFDEGIMLIKDIPDSFKLNQKQEIQKKAVSISKNHINKEEIKRFLLELDYPLYFMDFETYSRAMPMFDGVRPYQRIPFQFSLHILNSVEEEAIHHSFLYTENGDPRETFIKVLEELIGSTGTVVVYNQRFEQGVLKELSKQFPKYKQQIDNVIKRMRDLHAPFRAFHYYHPGQGGKTSLKNVLPAVTDKTYEGLEIMKGDEASIKYLHAIYDKTADKNEKKKIIKDLEEYCGLDTDGLVHITKKLYELVNVD